MVKIIKKFLPNKPSICYRVTNYLNVKNQPWDNFRMTKSRLKALEKEYPGCVIERKIRDRNGGLPEVQVLWNGQWVHWIDYMREMIK